MTETFVDRRSLAAIVLACALVVLAALPATAAVTTLRAGASDPEGTTAPALAIGKLCELATRLSNGELNVQPFYQSLGVEQQLAAAVKAGSVDIGHIAVSNAARLTDAFLQFDLPFLFRNDRAYMDVLENHPAGKKALAQFEKDLGVKVLLPTSHTYDAEVSGTDLQTRDKPVKVPVWQQVAEQFKGKIDLWTSSTGACSSAPTWVSGASPRPWR